MKITSLGDAHSVADAIRLADTIQKRLNDAGYSLAVMTPNDADPVIVLLADDRQHTVVSLTGQLWHLDTDDVPDTDRLAPRGRHYEVSCNPDYHCDGHCGGCGARWPCPDSDRTPCTATDADQCTCDTGIERDTRHPDTDTDPVADTVACQYCDEADEEHCALHDYRQQPHGDTVAQAAYRATYPDAYTDTDPVACGAPVCTGLGEHRHGGTCNPACPCKATRYRSGGNAPGARPGGAVAPSEGSSAVRDAPEAPEAAEEASVASAMEEAIVRLRATLNRRRA